MLINRPDLLFSGIFNELDSVKWNENSSVHKKRPNLIKSQSDKKLGARKTPQNGNVIHEFRAL